MGLVTLPVSGFLYWLMLRSKKEAPFPKGGLLRLVIAGAVSVVLSVLLTAPVSGVLSFFRLGIFSNLSDWIRAFRESPDALAELIRNSSGNVRPTFLWALVSMFFSAGLLEEGLKYLTCRAAVRKEGMVRTWMDSVAAFAFVGITFELLENIAFGMNSEFVAALFRAIAPAHFVFGVIMGYFYGKYLVTGQKRYRLLSLAVPVLYHTVTNALISVIDLDGFLHVLGIAAALSHIAAAVLTVIIVIRWQKNGTLDVPVRQKQAAEGAGSRPGEDMQNGEP